MAPRQRRTALGIGLIVIGVLLFGRTLLASTISADWFPRDADTRVHIEPMPENGPSMHSPEQVGQPDDAPFAQRNREHWGNWDDSDAPFFNHSPNGHGFWPFKLLRIVPLLLIGALVLLLLRSRKSRNGQAML